MPPARGAAGRHDRAGGTGGIPVQVSVGYPNGAAQPAQHRLTYPSQTAEEIANEATFRRLHDAVNSGDAELIAKTMV